MLVWLDAEARSGAPEPGDDPHDGPPVAHLWSGPTTTCGVGVYWERDVALYALDRDPDAERANELARAHERGRHRRSEPPPQVRSVGARVSIDPGGEGVGDLGSDPDPEIAAVIEGGAWLRVVTFVELDDGRRISDEAHGTRLFSLGKDLWAIAIDDGDQVPDVCDLEPPAIRTRLSELAEDATFEAQRNWFPLRLALAEEGIDAEDADLANLPFEVEFDDQLRESLPP